MTMSMVLDNPVARELGWNGGLTCACECKDIQRTIEWYRDLLGFKLEYLMEDIGWCELISPVARVYVGFSQVEQLKTGAGPTLTFGVDDIDHARSTLESKGVKFDGETRTYEGMVKLASFYDPDGNSLMLFQSLASSQ